MIVVDIITTLAAVGVMFLAAHVSLNSARRLLARARDIWRSQ